MQRHEAHKVLPLIKAFADGKELEFKNYLGVWVTATDVSFGCDIERYRIKPEPTWRPWKPNEVPKFFMVSLKDVTYFEGSPSQLAQSFIAMSDSGSGIIKVKAYRLAESFLPNVMFHLFNRLDEHGNVTPCGVLEDK